MSQRSGQDFLFRFLICLSAWLLCVSRPCRAEGITQFTRRDVVVNVDGEEILTTNSSGTVTSLGICPYVDVYIEGEISGSVSRLVPEDGFLCGSYAAGKYFRIGVGRADTTQTIPSAEESREIHWDILGMGSKPFAITRYMRVRDARMDILFDGQSLQTAFQVCYQKTTYMTSGLLMKASGYAGTENKNAFGVYEEWFRARYNHNYQICYDYGFVQAEKRGLSLEQGILHENLTYFALPKQLTDPGGDSRYQFLGWQLSGEGGEYTPGQGIDKASYRYGQPAESSIAAVDLSELSLTAPAELTAETAAVETAAGMRSTASTLTREGA